LEGSKNFLLLSGILTSLKIKDMKKSFITFFMITVFIFPYLVAGQGITISDVPHTLDPSAVLDAHSSSKGFLAPRMTGPKRLAIANPAAGLMVFDSTSASYWFYNGTAWAEFNFEDIWARVPGLQHVYVANINDLVGIGTNIPGHKLHISDMGLSPRPPVMVEQTGGGDASVLMFNQPGMGSYVMGYDISQGSFEVGDSLELTGNTPNDFHTKFTISGTGITHLNHQSRARASLTGGGGIGQMIPIGVWTTVQFNVINFDEQNELGNPPTAFIAREEGYYQCNARAEFAYDNPPSPSTYISIRIVVNGMPVAEGSKHCMADNNSDVNDGNNACVVSDVLRLTTGSAVTIEVFQNFGIGWLIQGLDKVYVSIHKSS
jgi:hypothetical protein